MKLSLSCTSFTWEGGTGAIAERFREAARGAERQGLTAFFVMDHFWQIPGVGRKDEPMLESYSALSFAAACTSRIRLGALVTGAVYRPPGFLVKQVTALDVLSRGRAILGIGAAWNDEEAAGLGLPFGDMRTRFEILEETLQVVRRMWSGDTRPFHGSHASLEAPLNSPQPLSNPRPPILIGGNGEKKTLRLVAEYGDACNLFEGVDVPHKLDVLRRHCERAGRSFEEIARTLHFVVKPGQSADQTVQRCQEWGEQGIEHVIAAVPDAADPYWQEYLGHVGRQIAGFGPRQLRQAELRRPAEALGVTTLSAIRT